MTQSDFQFSPYLSFFDTHCRHNGSECFCTSLKRFPSVTTLHSIAAGTCPLPLNVSLYHEWQCDPSITRSFTGKMFFKCYLCINNKVEQYHKERKTHRTNTSQEPGSWATSVCIQTGCTKLVNTLWSTVYYFQSYQVIGWWKWWWPVFVCGCYDIFTAHHSQLNYVVACHTSSNNLILNYQYQVRGFKWTSWSHCYHSNWLLTINLN